MTFRTWQKGAISGSMQSKGAPMVGEHGRTTRPYRRAGLPSTSEFVRLDLSPGPSVHGPSRTLRLQAAS
jgi:hypothetical protein